MTLVAIYKEHQQFSHALIFDDQDELMNSISAISYKQWPVHIMNLDGTKFRLVYDNGELSLQFAKTQKNGPEVEVLTKIAYMSQPVASEHLQSIARNAIGDPE